MNSKYCQWKNSFAYVGKGVSEGTMEEAMIHFFYDGLSPWLQSFGYKWAMTEHQVSYKFLRLCYDIHCTLKMDPKYTLEPPEPPHRNLIEDRETFDYFIDSSSFIEFLEEWSFRDDIVGTRFEHLLLEFCYVWINPFSGPPGTYTQKILDANDDELSDEDNSIYPESNWSRRKYDLY